MTGIPAEVYQNANPFTSFNRLGGFDDYDDEEAAFREQQQQLRHNANAPASPASAERIASASAASRMQSPSAREEAMHRLQQQHQREQQQHAADQHSPTLLPGGAASLDELLSRAAALDRECFDLQNEVARWERDAAECQGDIERVSVSCKRYASELGHAESNVEELNKWFQEHTCANDPERYERVRDVSQEVCALRMRIGSLEQQLETLLEGTLTTTNFSPSRRDGGGGINDSTASGSADPEGLNSDDSMRIVGMLQQLSSSLQNNNSGGGGGGTPLRQHGDNAVSYSSLMPVASPARLPPNANTTHLKRYLADLEQKTLEQDVRIMRLKEAADKRDRLLAQERDNDMEIQRLRQKLEQAGIDLPVAPIQHRISRALRRNQMITSGGGGGGAGGALASSSAHVALAGGSEVVRRTVRLPSGVLRELTKELQASVRQVAHRCGVGEIAVEIAADATLLHCRGVLRAVNAFEDEVTAAADRCKRQRALGGLVTYAVPEVAAVIAQSTDKIAALLQPEQQRYGAADNTAAAAAAAATRRDMAADV
jgi:hypothetical protein